MSSSAEIISELSLVFSVNLLRECMECLISNPVLSSSGVATTKKEKKNAFTWIIVCSSIASS